MKPTMKDKVVRVKGFAIYGDWGMTIASSPKGGHLAHEEARLKKLGFHSYRLPCEIIIHLKGGGTRK